MNRHYSLGVIAVAVLAAMVFGVSAKSPVLAADLSNFNGQACADGGTWHFVNNQTGGAAAGFLTAVFDTGTVTIGATAVNKSNQHFTFSFAGSLVDASTNLPGKLVLSDFSCDGGGKEEPPKGEEPPK